jgi:hypothetical protein
MMSASLRLKRASVSGLRRNVVVPTDLLLVTEFGPAFCAYSPSFLEYKFLGTQWAPSSIFHNSTANLSCRQSSARKGGVLHEIPGREMPIRDGRALSAARRTWLTHRACPPGSVREAGVWSPATQTARHEATGRAAARTSPGRPATLHRSLPLARPRPGWVRARRLPTGRTTASGRAAPSPASATTRVK